MATSEEHEAQHKGMQEEFENMAEPITIAHPVATKEYCLLQWVPEGNRYLRMSFSLNKGTTPSALYRFGVYHIVLVPKSRYFAGKENNMVDQAGGFCEADVDQNAKRVSRERIAPRMLGALTQLSSQNAASAEDGMGLGP